MNEKKQENWFVLDKASAVNLWLQGEDVWNEFVEKHNYNFNVDFSGVDFSKHVSADEAIKFDGYLFPGGTTSFSGLNFGSNGVSFKNSELGSRTLFALTNFGDGNLIFENLEIEGSISFDSLTFKKGCLKFTNCDLWGQISFFSVDIENGRIEFNDTEVMDVCSPSKPIGPKYSIE